VKWLLVAAVVASTAAGEILQAIGMRRHGEIREFRPGAVARLLGLLAKNRFVAASIACLAISFFSFAWLISIADLSFAVPATAASYVVETAFAAFLLKERVGVMRWTGAGLVACGVALLSL
jgi:drug/metabolite transporter (DMT)-like permease